MRTSPRFCFTVVMLTLFAAGCSKPTPPTPQATPDAAATPAPAPAPDVSVATPPAPAPDAAAPTPPKEPDVVAVAPARAWVAWRQADDSDRQMASALILDDGAGAKVVAERKDAVVVTFEGGAWLLGTKESSVAVRPCDDDGTASLVDLTITPLVPAGPTVTHVLADTQQRPAVGENAIHVEVVQLLTQIGPYVVLNHWMNSDICPIPAGGATYDVPRALDLRTGTLVPPKALLTADELAQTTAEALSRAVTSVREEYPDAPVADVTAALKLYDVEFGWSTAGAAQAQLVFAGESEHFEDPSGEAYAATTVDAATLPAALKPFASPPPAAVIAFWKGGGADGKGFAEVAPAAIAAVRAAFSKTP